MIVLCEDGVGHRVQIRFHSGFIFNPYPDAHMHISTHTLIHTQLPFDTRENPEVDALRTALTQRIFLGNLGGACIVRGARERLYEVGD